MAITLEEYRKKYLVNNKKRNEIIALQNKNNNKDNKQNKTVSSYEDYLSDKKIIDTALNRYNTYNEAISAVSNFSDEEINSALTQARNNMNTYKSNIINYANKNNIETSDNKNIVKSQTDYGKEELDYLRNNKYEALKNMNGPLKATDIASKAQEKYAENKEKFDKLIKKTDDYKKYDEYLYNAVPLLQQMQDINEVNNEEVSNADKIFAPISSTTKNSLRAIFMPSSGGYRLENGSMVNLPTKSDLKGEHVKDSYETWLGKLYGNVTSAIGQMLPSVAIGLATGGLGTAAGATATAVNTARTVGSLASMFANVSRNATNQKLMEGYTEQQANQYGLMSGAVETATEMMFGGLGKLMGTGALDRVVTDRLTRNIQNRVFKTLADAGISSVGEGIEEVVSDLLQPVVQQIALDDPRKYSEIMKDQNVLEDFLVGTVSSLIMSAPSTVVSFANNSQNNQTNNSSQVNLPQANSQESIVNDAVNSRIEQNNIKAPTLNEKQNINLPSINNQNNNIFSQQVDEVIKGTFNKDNHMTVLEHTPEVLQRLGVKDYPITLTVNKLDRIMNESGNQNGEYHGLGIETVKKIPQALQNPLDIIKSHNNSYVLTTDLSDSQNRQVIASIKIDGKGYIDNIEIDTNVMTSAYGRNNYDSWMQNHQNKGNIVYDIDRGYVNTKKLDTIPRLQLPNNNIKYVKSDVKDRGQFPMRDSSSSTSTSDIPKNTSPISYNNNSTNLTQSQIAPLLLNNMQNDSDNIQNINLPNFNRVLNPVEISQLTSEDASTTPILPNVNRNQVNDSNSKFYRNIKEKTNMLNEQQKNTILSEEEVQYYDKITNKESLEKAFERLNENGRHETENWFAKDSENATAVDIAEGWILLKQYADNNDSDGMVAVAKKLRDMGTKAGQTVQAFNIMARMTPEGMVKYAQSELSEAYDRMVKGKTQKWIDKYQKDFDLTPQETGAIMEIMKKVSTMEDGYDKRVELAKIQKIMTDKLPPERGAGIKSWMRISMLFNAKTQVRNVMGNAVIAPVNAFSDLFASMADKVVGAKTGYRTTGVTNVKNYVKGFKEGAYQSYNDFRKGINTRNIQGNRFEISEGKSFNNNTSIGKALNRVDSLLSFMLDAGDRTFYEATFTNSINNQLVLNNTTEVTQEMIDIATQEALSRTWQDNNEYTRMVLGVRKGLNKLGKFFLLGNENYGLGDILIPFAKTPANLTKAIVDYSPVGLVNSLAKGKKLKNAIETGQFTPQMQHDFVQSLGKATVGTMLYVAGYALAKAGIVSGESDDDKDVRDFMKNTLGVNSYSIKIGNKSFTYDWAQPIAAPLSIMANIVQKDKEDANLLEKIFGSLDTAGNILLEQSFMESINTALSNNDGLATGIEEAILDLPARAIPTFMKQIVDLTDSTQRTSFEYNKPIQSMINSVKAKIPGLSKTLAPSVDTMGREIQRYGGNNNIFNVFLNPANVSTENISESAEEIYRLYKATGDKTIMPRVAPYYVDQTDGRITLDSKTKSEYQKVSGSIIEESVERLLNDTDYQNLNDTDKASVIKSIVDFSYNKAKEEVLDISMSNEYNKINQYLDMGGNVADYYMNKEEINYSLSNPEKYATILQITDYDNYLSYKGELESIRDGTENKKEATIRYVDSLNLTLPQKAMFIRQYYSSYDYYNEQIVNYIKQNVSSVEERSAILTELGFTIRNGRVYW